MKPSTGSVDVPCAAGCGTFKLFPAHLALASGSRLVEGKENKGERIDLIGRARVVPRWLVQRGQHAYVVQLCSHVSHRKLARAAHAKVKGEEGLTRRPMVEPRHATLALVRRKWHAYRHAISCTSALEQHVVIQ